MVGKRHRGLQPGDWVTVAPLIPDPEDGETELNRLDLAHEGCVVNIYKDDKKKSHLVCVRVEELGGVVDFHVDRIAVEQSSEEVQLNKDNKIGRSGKKRVQEFIREEDGGIGDRIATEVQHDCIETFEFMRKLLQETTSRMQGRNDKLLRMAEQLHQVLEKSAPKIHPEISAASLNIEQHHQHQLEASREEHGQEEHEHVNINANEAEPNRTNEEHEPNRTNEEHLSHAQSDGQIHGLAPEISEKMDKDEEGRRIKSGMNKDDVHISKEAYELLQQRTNILVAILKRAFLLSKEGRDFHSSQEVKALLSTLSAEEKAVYYKLVHIENPRHRLLMQKLTGEVQDLTENELTKSLDRAIYRLLKKTHHVNTARMYTDAEVKFALKAWCNKRGSQEDLRLCFGVPRQTLRHHYSSFIKYTIANGISPPDRKELPNQEILEELLNVYMHTLKPRGGQRILTEEEERLIAGKLDLAGKMKGGLSSRDVRIQVKNVIDSLTQDEHEVQLSPRTRARLEKFKASRGFGKQFISRNKIKSSKRKKAKVNSWLQNSNSNASITTKEIVDELKKHKQESQLLGGQVQYEEHHSHSKEEELQVQQQQMGYARSNIYRQY